MIVYYRLIKTELDDSPPPDGKIQLVTAAVWSCALCGSTISGMGGPGNGELCLQCAEDIIDHKLTYSRT